MSWTDYSSAPPRGTWICAAEDVGETASLIVKSAAGELPLLLLRTGAGLRAYVNACPHQFLPLDYRGAQVLSADGSKLLCTAHGASFDATTGAPLSGADCGLDGVPVVERAGHVWIG